IDREQDTWQLVQSDSETCSGDRCPYMQRRECLFYRARSRAERAHLVVINHALLLSDLALENRLLPEYSHVIIDEAHHLEEQATDQFGVEIAQRDLYAYLNNLSHAEGAVHGGLLADVPGLLRQHAVSEEALSAIGLRIDALRPQIDQAEGRLYGLFDTLESFLGGQQAEAGNAQGAGSSTLYDQEVRLTTGVRTQPGWSKVEVVCEELTTALGQMLKDLDALINDLGKLQVENDPDGEELLQNLRAQARYGVEFAGNLNRILLEPEENGIYWISVSTRRNELKLCSAPLHVGGLLSERLFAEKESVVLTSATLRSNKSFKFIRGRLGLQDAEELAVDSPFDYQSAALLYVPKDIPEPNQAYYQKNVEKAVVDIVRATEGRALVLFTSNSQLNATYRAIQRPLEQDGIVVYGQGLDGSRRQILENFKGTPKSVLLGTRSFWEGVDVVGEALSCLIITRLPFAVPTDPVLTARAETFEDPFNEFYLPESILRFRQGFGRLIRSKSDVGIVVVLDKRLLTKAYGPTILRSLPPCLMRQGPLESLPERARAWLDPATRK
ncbi:MAG: DNA polymerase III subunit epsilon, partial [Chloroflexi bacterium]|nr:DNA polymerase III subunit epsilon [Chloroflexota bacterium]